MRTSFRQTIAFLFLIGVLLGPSCRVAPDEATIERNRELLGSWKQVMVEESGPRATTVRHFFLDRDGFLKVGFAEIGPRSRTGMIDEVVEYDGERIRWREGGAWFDGTVNAGRTSISLEYGSGENPTAYSFVRYPEGDALWRDLKAGIDARLEYEIPEEIGDGWRCATLDSVGLDREKAYELVRRIASGKYKDLHGILLIKDGALALEEYFADNGRMRGLTLRRVFGNKLHHLGSTTKSVTSLLIGIAIDRGFIEDVDVPVFEFFPEYSRLRTAEKDRILLRHLLTMTAGLDWDQFSYGLSDSRNDAARMWRGGDVLEYTLAKPVVAEPGEEFNYSNGVSTLLGGILKNATGQEADAFANEQVFGPLGITEFEWTRYPDGSIETDGGLALRPRDLAKIGQLFLDRGEWNGRQIVSREWIEESTQTHIRFRRSKGGYGYKWQQMTVESRSGTVDYYFMPGYGGNLLAVFPGFDMVVVFTGANYEWDVRSVYKAMFEDYLLEALRAQ